jgi:hypothetical protein
MGIVCWILLQHSQVFLARYCLIESFEDMRNACHCCCLIFNLPSSLWKWDFTRQANKAASIVKPYITRPMIIARAHKRIKVWSFVKWTCIVYHIFMGTSFITAALARDVIIFPDNHRSAFANAIWSIHALHRVSMKCNLNRLGFLKLHNFYSSVHGSFSCSRQTIISVNHILFPRELKWTSGSRLSSADTLYIRSPGECSAVRWVKL